MCSEKQKAWKFSYSMAVILGIFLLPQIIISGMSNAFASAYNNFAPKRTASEPASGFIPNSNASGKDLAVEPVASNDEDDDEEDDSADIEIDPDTLPQYLRLSEVERHIVGNKIEWQIVQGSGIEGKRLQPMGLISKKCISQSKEAPASMEVRPNPKNPKELLVFTNLTSACQKPDANGAYLKAKNFKNTNGRKNRANAISLSSLFTNLNIPTGFGGKIKFCAIKNGDTNNFEQRIADSCDELTLVDKSGKEYVDTNTNQIISPQEKVAKIVEKEKAAKEASEAEEKKAQDREVAEIKKRITQATCNGNLELANSQIKKLAEFGYQVGSIIKNNSAASLVMFNDFVKNAKTQEELDTILAKFQRAERHFRGDDKGVNSLKGKWMDKAVDIVTNNISELSSVDSKEGREAKSTIDALRKKPKEIGLTGKDAKEKLSAVDKAFRALTDKAMSLNERDRAKELVDEGEEKSTGMAKLDYIRAKRTILQAEFKNCVNKYADKYSSGSVNSGFEKCEKIRNSAEKTHKRLEDEAQDVASESTREKYREEGTELFGRSYGVVQTAFGPIMQQPSYGSMDLYRQQTIQEIYMNQMYRMQGMGGMNMLGSMNGMAINPGMMMNPMFMNQMNGMNGGFRQNTNSFSPMIGQQAMMMPMQQQGMMPQLPF